MKFASLHHYHFSFWWKFDTYKLTRFRKVNGTLVLAEESKRVSLLLLHVPSNTIFHQMCARFTLDICSTYRHFCAPVSFASYHFHFKAKWTTEVRFLMIRKNHFFWFIISCTDLEIELKFPIHSLIGCISIMMLQLQSYFNGNLCSILFVCTVFFSAASTTSLKAKLHLCKQQNKYLSRETNVIGQNA